MEKRPETKIVAWLARSASQRAIWVSSLLSFASRSGVLAQPHPGDVDLSFGTGPSNEVAAIALQADGKFVIGGYFTGVSGTNRNYIARLNADGSLDTSFDPGTGAAGGRGSTAVYAVASQPDNKALLAGRFATVNGVSRNRIARLNADGSLDLTFNPGTGLSGTFDILEAVVMQPDGKVLIGGSFSSVNGTNRNNVARLNADGSLDLTFDPGTGPSDTVDGMALQTDGRILIGGLFSSVNGTNSSHVARLNPDGSLDASFNLAAGAADVYSIVVQLDGRIVIAGSFTSVSGTNRNYIARLNADGSLDTSFDPGTGAGNYVYAILSAGGKVYLGGLFSSVNGTNRARIARLNSDGSLDTGFDPGTGANSLVEALVLQPDGKIVVGGGFTTINGVPRPFIARLYGTSRPLLSTPIYSASQFQLNVSGESNTCYLLQGSTNFLQANWIPVWTNMAPFTATDSAAAIFPRRFYRAILPP
jgi:uncharacterized delta-60 repeat protein